MARSVFRPRRLEKQEPSEDRHEEVIVADDDGLVLELVLAGLRRAGVACRGVVDGEAALKAVNELQPRLVVLDWLMPGCNGLDVCRRLKADSVTSAVHVVMLTSRGAEEQVTAAYEAGADDYLTKPFDVAELVRVVQGGLERR